MIRPSLLRASSAVALVGLLTLAGCSGDKKSGANGAEPEEGPLSKIMSAAWGDYDQESVNKEQIEVENLVAECMAAEGFDYSPQDYSSMSGAMVSSVDFADQNTKEWVAKNGYGMSMGMETEEPTDGETQEEWVDPNADYVASLSESEQTAFYEALYGVQPEMTDEEMENYEYNWETSGCQGSAQHEVSGGVQDIYSDPKFEDLMESMNDLYSAGEKDPRMLELNTKWADCMADAGFSEFATPMDAMNSVSDAQSELYNFEGEMSEDYTGPSDEAIAEFRELELSTALADFTCKESVDMIKVSQEITFELEEAFVKDNKAALDEFVAAVQDSRK